MTVQPYRTILSQGSSRSSNPSRPRDSACVAELAHLLLTVSPTAPLPPPELIPLGLASYALPLATNVMATGLIVGKLWSMIRPPIVAADAPIFTSLGGYCAVRHAAEIVVESGVLYLVTQLVFVVLYAICHPALAIQTTIAVQVYVSLRAARRGSTARLRLNAR